jgi:hypothetical protein
MSEMVERVTRAIRMPNHDHVAEPNSSDGIPGDGYDATDAVAENNARRDEVRRQREDAETVKRLLMHKNGRAWFYRQLCKCHIYDTPFMPGDPHTTFFQLGQENIGKLMMMEAINACSDLYLTMLAEARKEEERIAALAGDAQKNREAEYDAGVRAQGLDLPPPAGWPRHVPPAKPDQK